MAVCRFIPFRCQLKKLWDKFTINNIIGVVFDKRALGICAFREKMTTNYTASADFWNNFYKVKLNMAMDSDYGMVAFILD